MTLQTTAPAQPRPSNALLITLSWVATVCTLGYLLPWAIAETGHKENNGGVLLVNLLTGWTLIGWIVALVMAVQADPRPVQVVIAGGTAQPAQGWYPAPDGYGQQWWDGTRWTEQRHHG